MLLTALVQTKGGTLVVNLPRDRIDLEIKIRSVGIQKTSNQIHIIADEDCDVSVKLFGESDIGRHLSFLFGKMIHCLTSTRHCKLSRTPSKISATIWS